MMGDQPEDWRLTFSCTILLNVLYYSCTIVLEVQNNSSAMVLNVQNYSWIHIVVLNLSDYSYTMV